MAQPQKNFKLKVLTLITKLADRDTYNVAAGELESIVVSLDGQTLPIFLSCILSTNSTDKALVRKQCLHLLSSISDHLQSNSLSPFLSKILTFITRRLRDSDSSIRAQCVTTVSALSVKITKPAFSTAFLIPLSECLFTEQESNAQTGCALCLAGAIDAAPDPDPGRLGKGLVQRVVKLVMNDGFKAKSAGLVLLGSVIGVGGVKGYGGMGGLVKCLVGFLSSEDWAARKAAAEALGRLAVVERDAMAEFKSGCLKVFESRRFDKVKAAREVMNQMIDAWKQVPDVSDEASPPPRSPRSLASSKEDASDGHYPPGSRNSFAASSVTPQPWRKVSLARRTTPDSLSAATARTRGSVRTVEKKSSPAITRKVDQKKPLDWIAVPNDSRSTGVNGNDLKENNNNAADRKSIKPGTRRSLFGKNSDEKTPKLGGCKSGSRVAPCIEVSTESTTAISNMAENINSNHKDTEDLSSIRNQLVQIERQQSSLLDLLQRFMGSSQNGMHALETRVHGLELALDEISYDLAVSSGRMGHSHRNSCCLLPGADFWSSKFSRKKDGRYSAARFSSSDGTPSLAAIRHRADKNGSAQTFDLGSSRLRVQGGGGFIVNPLAEIHDDMRGISEVAQH